MEEISIGHQQDLVGGLAEGAVIVALVEQAGLRRAGLGREGDDDRIAQRGQLPAQAGDKGGVGSGILRKDKLKVHIQSPVALGLKRFTDGRHQIVLNAPVIEHQTGKLIGKATLLRQGGKVHQGGHAQAFGGGDHGRVIQVHQAALRGDAVGEWC